YAVAALLALHSFPTRRSSDLRSAFRRFPVGGLRVLFRVQLGKHGFEVFARSQGIEVGIFLHVIHIFEAAAERPSDQFDGTSTIRSEEHTSELQSRENLVCRLL